MSNRVTVYLINYALTTGIVQVRALLTADGYARVTGDHTNTFDRYFSKSQYRLTLAEAEEVVSIMKLKKEAALERQLEKLRKLQLPGTVVKWDKYGRVIK